MPLALRLHWICAGRALPSALPLHQCFLLVFRDLLPAERPPQASCNNAALLPPRPEFTTSVSYFVLRLLVNWLFPPVTSRATRAQRPPGLPGARLGRSRVCPPGARWASPPDPLREGRRVAGVQEGVLNPLTQARALRPAASPWTAESSVWQQQPR